MDRASSSSDGAAAHQHLVMVVDDSATMRRSITMTLERGGYRVVAADNGAQALSLLRQGTRPDLLLTDIVMPQVDGLQLIREARQMLRFTPIVALTTQGQRPYRDEGKAAGATAWLIKPTGGHDLISLVQRFLGESKAAASSGTT